MTFTVVDAGVGTRWQGFESAEVADLAAAWCSIDYGRPTYVFDEDGNVIGYRVGIRVFEKESL